MKNAKARLCTASAVLTLLGGPTMAAALTPFPAGPALFYRCTQSLTAQGALPENVEAMCACTTGSMTNEFGLEGYDRMMRSHPDPNGSADDRLWTKIITACLKQIHGSLK